MRVCPLVVFGFCTVLGAATTARAAPCPVPSGNHATIQSAVDDPGCTEVQLGSQTYVEDIVVERTLEVSGVSSTATVIAGRILITGETTAVTLSGFTADASTPASAGCFLEAIDVEGGARMIGSNIVAVNGDGTACLLFGDGFEDGTTNAWAVTVP